jgi:hypothetical protein
LLDRDDLELALAARRVHGRDVSDALSEERAGDRRGEGHLARGGRRGAGRGGGLVHADDVEIALGAVVAPREHRGAEADDLERADRGRDELGRAEADLELACARRDRAPLARRVGVAVGRASSASSAARPRGVT